MGNENSKTNEKQRDHDGLRELPSQNQDFCVQGKESFSMAASNPDPEKLRTAYLSSDYYHLDETDKAALNINPNNYQYPFENIVLEGGGAKCLAFLGVIKCLEEMNMIGQIKRIAGCSAGAIFGMLFALGYRWDEMLEITTQNLDNSLFDHSCGLLSLVPNLFKKYGWNPGEKFYRFFGMCINERTGNPDTTFKQLYNSTGVELCIVVTNLNLKTVQYCHVKTTPDMPIRTAIRMSMAIPGVFYPGHYVFNGHSDVFVDGGILVNYPINCFDGWYLSMKQKDSFLFRLKSLDDLSSLSATTHRFDSIDENKTIGCIAYSTDQPENKQLTLDERVGATFPKKPKSETKLFCEMEKKDKSLMEEQREEYKNVKAVELFFEILHKHNVDENKHFITEDEFRAVLMDEAFSTEQQELLFGKGCHHDKVFGHLDKDENGRIEFNDIVAFITKNGVQAQRRIFRYKRGEINSLTSFLGALFETLQYNANFLVYKDTDIERTVGVNSGYVGTLDFELEHDDRSFVIDRGFNATMSFLRYYAVKHPTLEKKKQTITQEQATTSQVSESLTE